MELTSEGGHSPYVAVGGISQNSCGACADLEYSGISTLGQETFVPTAQDSFIPVSPCIPIPHAECTFVLCHAFKNEKSRQSRQRSGARRIGRIWASTEDYAEPGNCSSGSPLRWADLGAEGALDVAVDAWSWGDHGLIRTNLCRTP